MNALLSLVKTHMQKNTKGFAIHPMMRVWCLAVREILAMSHRAVAAFKLSSRRSSEKCLGQDFSFLTNHHNIPQNGNTTAATLFAHTLTRVSGLSLSDDE